jgi:hypothetical protein
MRNIILSISLLYLFTGCATNNLTISQNTIELNSCTIKGSFEKSFTKKEGVTLRVIKDVYKSGEKEFLVHEKGKLDEEWIFVTGPVSAIGAGFDFTYYNYRSLDDFHDYIEGITRDNEHIFMISQSYFQGFSIIYSNNPNLITPIAACLSKKRDIDFPIIKDMKSANNWQNPIKSNWGPKIFFERELIRRKQFNDI